MDVPHRYMHNCIVYIHGPDAFIHGPHMLTSMTYMDVSIIAMDVSMWIMDVYTANMDVVHGCGAWIWCMDVVHGCMHIQNVYIQGSQAYKHDTHGYKHVGNGC